MATKTSSKNKWMKALLVIVAVFAVLLIARFGLGPNNNGESGTESESKTESESQQESKKQIKESGQYTSKKDVALYIYTYGHLPSNFITKGEAEALGWPGGDLWKYANGKSIGGDYFGNYEERLPVKEGRVYHECDIGYKGGKRDDRRIVYSNDGLIYYTDDHYVTFTLLYGEP